jgi:hypothetical protein
MRIPSANTSIRSAAIIGFGAWLALLAGGCEDDEGVVTGEFSMTSDGGTFVVQCIDENMSKLVSWQPNPGYVARVIVPGPSREASLTFESGTATDIRVAVHCVDSQPRMEQFDDEDTSIG